MAGYPADAFAPLQHRILARIQARPFGCWIWVSGIDHHGYGYLRHRGQLHKAHRLAYEAWVGEIPQGLEIDHLCSVKACVKPFHLDAVTHAENISRAFRRRRPVNNPPFSVEQSVGVAVDGLWNPQQRALIPTIIPR